jgi:thiamine-phosphate diphosphorylase
MMELMPRDLPRLYAITDRALGRMPHEEIIAQLILGGARLIQLRDKSATASDLLETSRRCLRLTRAAGATLIINDRVEVALAAGADGVHLGQGDMTVAEARAILGPERIIGLSTHSLAQLRAGLATSASYLAVGPIYATGTKDDTEEVVGLELIREARRHADRPLVAIGGITRERAREVIEAGADTIAVISALYPPPRPELPLEGDAISARVRDLLLALS